MCRNRIEVHDVIEFACVKGPFTGEHERFVTNFSGSVCEEKILRNHVTCLGIDLDLEERIIPLPRWRIWLSKKVRGAINVITPFWMSGRQVEEHLLLDQEGSAPDVTYRTQRVDRKRLIHI